MKFFTGVCATLYGALFLIGATMIMTNGCAEKKIPSPILAIGGAQVSVSGDVLFVTDERGEAWLSPQKEKFVVRLYGITEVNPAEARMGVQQFLEKYPTASLQHVATRVKDQMPLVIMWSKKEKDDHRISVQEILLRQGIVKIEKTTPEKTFGKQRLQDCPVEKEVLPTLTSTAALFQEYEKEAKDAKRGIWKR